MSYAPKRKSISEKLRAEIFALHKGICWLCKLKIEGGEPYDIDHQVSRELGGSDEIDNLAPAHKDCHKAKSKRDVAAIAKSNRIRARIDGTRRKRKAIPSRGFQSGRKFPKKPLDGGG